MYTARFHPQNTAKDSIPPREVVEPFIDRITDPNHWLWSGEFFESAWLGGDAPRLAEEAMISWCVVGKKKRRYSVVRLLFQYQRGESIHAGKITNVCGLSTCVDPSHWTEAVRAPKPVLTSLETHKGKRGRLRGFSPGKWSDVHVVDFDRGGDITACGRALDGLPRVGPARLQKTITTTGIRSKVSCAACQRQMQLNTHWYFSSEASSVSVDDPERLPIHVVHASYANPDCLPRRVYMDKYLDCSNGHWRWLLPTSKAGPEIMLLWPLPISYMFTENHSVLRVLFRLVRMKSVSRRHPLVNTCGQLWCCDPNHWEVDR